MHCQNSADEEVPTKPFAAGLTHFDTDSDYQRWIPLAVWEAKEAGKQQELHVQQLGSVRAGGNQHENRSAQLCREISVEN